MADPHPIPLGAAPRPTRDDDLEARLRAAIAAHGPTGAHGLDAVRVVARLDGPDVATLRIDASGVVVRGRRPAAVRFAEPGDVVSREPAALRQLEIVAHPVTVENVPVAVDVTAEGVRFSWVTTSDDQVFVEATPPTQDEPVHGAARVTAPRRAVDAAVEAALRDALEQRGFRLVDLDLQLRNDGPRALSVGATATVQKSFMRAAATLTASASVDEALVLQVADARLTGSNALVDAALAPLRPKVAAATSRRVDLAALLPPGVTVTDVRITAGTNELALAVTLG